MVGNKRWGVSRMLLSTTRKIIQMLQLERCGREIILKSSSYAQAVLLVKCSDTNNMNFLLTLQNAPR